jgi:hypothetical protein
MAGEVEKKLEDMNIIANRQLLPGDLQAGRHYTNLGGEVLHVALTTDKADLMKRRVRGLRRLHQRVKYSFDNSPAYFYR